MQRRHFMRIGLAGSALLPGLAAASGAGLGMLRWVQLPDGRAQPVAAAGDWLAVDASVVSWQGDGLYLYPAWGSPQPYFVRGATLAGGEVALEFCELASGRVLWRDSRQPVFAGRVQGRLPAQIDAWLGRRPELPLLQLPRLPT